MNCTKCGKEIPDGENKLCDECQAKLLEEISSEEKEQVTTSENNDSEFKKVEEKKNGLSKIIKIICFLLIAVALVVIALCIYLNYTAVEEGVGNTIGNIRNFGYATEYKGWIYYLSPNSDGSKVGIYKISNDGKYKEEIYMSSVDIISLNAYKNYIYFITDVQHDDNEEDKVDNKIYRMRTDGSNLEVINDNDFNNECYEIYVLNNAVYYIGKQANICKMNLDGSNKQVVVDNDTGYLGVTDKYIVYNKLSTEGDETNYVTYIMDIDGTNERPLVEGKRLYSVNIEDDYVYYINSENLIYKTQIDSNTEELVYNTEAYNLNIKDGYAYYLNYIDYFAGNYSVAIYRVKLNRENEDEIAQMVKKLETYSMFIDIVGDWVIYMDNNDEAGMICLANKEGSGETIELFSLKYADVASNQSQNEETTQLQSEEETEE